jgi:hypothetical protein
VVRNARGTQVYGTGSDRVEDGERGRDGNEGGTRYKGGTRHERMIRQHKGTKYIGVYCRSKGRSTMKGRGGREGRD